MKNLKKLSRKDLKNFVGGILDDGGGSCRITVSYPGGGYGIYDTPTSGSCSNQSSQANQQCLAVGAGQGGVRCRYDCACDGYGQ
ncbi:hypothetical protein EIH07_10695 [Chryseobacterium taklimakanense]|nr:hypothetical protein EIH07_10695 [Chryseobacterium taklimakanense]